MKHKKLLVLGASGGCGQWAVRIVKERGYDVTVLVRSEAAFEKLDGVKVVEGNVLDVDVLERVMEGQDVVLSCLGIKRQSASNPWSALVSPPDFTKHSAQNIVHAMNKHGIPRVIAISAAGVGDSQYKVNPIISFMIRKSNIALAYRDLENMEELYRKSDIDSLVVRPVTLVNNRTTNRARLIDHYKFSSKIAKSDVAEWMLDAVERPRPFENPSEMIGWS